jgi:uncharacterized protein (TIGR00375 family)
MRLIADFHIHSKYSRATSRFADLTHYTEQSKLKGVNLIGTGDILHPTWRKEIKESVNECGEGVYCFNNTYLILTVEVSTISFQNNVVRKVHHVIHFPNFDVVEQVYDVLAKRFAKALQEDGRPQLHMSPAELVEIVKESDKNTFIYPAHAWTPWFGVFGSKSGFDNLKHAYEDQTHHIKALETGLSSDPIMNWALSALDNVTLLSNSDAHSPEKLGRESNVLNVKELSFTDIHHAIVTKQGFEKTFEFYPQEGKYYYDGHRKCNVWLDPSTANRYHNICPVCKKPLTLGVLHRVMELADRTLGYKPKNAPPFQYYVPLKTLIAKAIGKGENTKAVLTQYDKLVRYFGNELSVYESDDKDVITFVEEPIRSLLLKAKHQQLKWRPGFDGVFGEIILKDVQSNLFTYI